MPSQYDEKYSRGDYYWGIKPSAMCYRVLELMFPIKALKLLDIGCGEGRNALFFARTGYDVTAFDLSAKGIEKTKRLASSAGLSINAYTANMEDFRPQDDYDVFFSTGTLHCIPEKSRKEIFQSYKDHTVKGGIHAFSVFVEKPFIDPAPDSDDNAEKWVSGELFTHYSDWKIEFCTEEIFDCVSSGVPHKHACNRIIARKV